MTDSDQIRGGILPDERNGLGLNPRGEIVLQLMC